MGFVALWAATGAAAVVVSEAHIGAVVWPAAAGGVALVASWWRAAALPVLVTASLLPAAFGGVHVFPWFLAAVALVLAGSVRPRTAAPPLEPLQRQLLRARRRGDGAALVTLLLGPRDDRRVDDVLRTTRATDTYVVLRDGRRTEVIGLLDGEDVEEALVEQRLAAALGGRAGAFGWARFPADGVALLPLLERARASAATRTAGQATARLDERRRGITRAAVLRRLAAAPAEHEPDAKPPSPPSRLPAGSRVLVTGAAGFVGSHLSERLLDLGHEVVGIDCFTSFYAREIKEDNLVWLRSDPRFSFRELDLAVADLSGLLDGIEAVFHLAAQPGVRTSFGDSLAVYLRHNVLATQRLLEEAVGHPLATFTYASSSSVYGNSPTYPTTEETPRRPVSPYGMTKAATEDVAGVYHRCFGVPTVGLRYFTAYGPRQRPDMAFTRFLTRAIQGQPVPLYGDGRQVRDFTFVDDVVEGTVAAAMHGRPGATYNIGGGHPVELRECIAIIEDLLGREVEIDRHPAQVGDVRMTGCDVSLARHDLGYEPTTPLADGLGCHLEWLTARAAGERPLVATG